MTRPRVTVAVGGATVEEMISAFRFSAEGRGLRHMLNGWTFPSEAAARAGWQQVRRAVWAQSHRFGVPRAAQFYDGLSYGALELLLFAWNQERLPLSEVLEALAADRAALKRFARTTAAHPLLDFLDLAQPDLDEIERTARALAAWSGPYWRRPYPSNLISSAVYGDGIDAPAERTRV